ncbi:hypothetical protein [Haloplanus aerogenes]|uniref:Uncharacterized protein n=1 Tax=Haloplanus aerogenes TaxID=660522 RepID=A0A3M0CVN5_9EURY|nr:hypothetical protein [Haloplanus aerogenes]AZH24089.1 hypothetical protein DU502_01280 [Haloplanus aerogenes]RMB13134.1 hypothetical protein ATH50_2465 [Haloplanus aerogenes]
MGDVDDELGGLETSLAEARRFLDEQLSSIDNVDGKAIQLFQVVTVLLGLLLSLLSFVYDGREATAVELLNPFTLAGLACLVGAMAAAAITYATGEYHAGVGAEDLRWIADGGYADGEFRRSLHTDLLTGYADWIDANRRANQRQSVFITVTILAIIYGIASLSVGVVVALVPSVGLPFAAVLLVVLASITWLLDPITQFRRLRHQ